MGWKPVGFSEIEKFPSQVLAHHYPTVTNFGDMTKYKEWNLNDSIGLLVGGTPCQSFSVAGLRKGLDDPRGNLALTYLGILDHFRPKWCVWENVPGVLSSGGGKDFGSFLGALGELGYGWAYRVLDAQNFGVAQRRRRVFVVGHLGDWKPAAEVLFESESLRGNIKESKNKGEEVARCITTRSATNLCSETGNFVTNASYSFDDHREGLRIYKESTSTLCAAAGTGGGNVPLTMAIQGNLIGRDKGGPQGIGVSSSETMYTLTKADVHAVACIGGQHPNAAISENISPTLTNAMGSGGGHVPCVAQQPINSFRYGEHQQDTLHHESGIMSTLPGGSKENAGHYTKTVVNMAVRRLTPVECERLQGFPDNYTNIPKAADGNRYKALGNSMAVPVMRWIGERINQYEQRGVEKHL
jgi:DNA (cytosine-5)-methyltransferase 1